MNPLRSITAFFALLLWSCMALAAATVITVQGDVQMTPVQGAPSQLAPGQRVKAGASIQTSFSGGVSLRFDDGQMLALSGNTSFIITEYKFNPHKPEESSFIGSLLKGGLRAVTGIIGEANKDNFTVKSEVATIGIRGTDFVLYYNRKLYLAVLEGAIFAKNEDGEEVFGDKIQPYGKVVNDQTKPQPITEDELPADALAALRELQRYSSSGEIMEPDPADPNCEDRR